MSPAVNLKTKYIVLIIIIAILFVFWDLPKTFFQQDEWQFFGSLIYALDSEKPLLNIILPFSGGMTHFFPLSNLLFLLEYSLFKTNFSPYAWINIFIHILNTLLVFILLNKISKKRIIAFLAALLFALNSISHQAVSWIVNIIGTLPASSFILISLIFYFKYVENEKRKPYFWFSLIFLGLSLLFKETGLFLFALYPLVWLIKQGVKIKKQLLYAPKYFLPLICLGLFYGCLRGGLAIFNLSSSQPEVVNVSRAPLLAYFYRIGSIPFKSVAQSLVPAKVILGWSRMIIHLAYPQFIAVDGTPNPYIAESLVFDLIAYFLTIAIIFICYFVFKYLLRKKEKILANALIFSLILLITSSLPFVFIPGRAGYFSIFEPRNLYIPIIGSSLMMAIFVYCLIKVLGQQKKNIFFLTIFIPIPLLIFHLQSVRFDLKKLVAVSQLRKSFLVDIKKTYPRLPEKVIFYVISDRPYYGLPVEEQILPVQLGFGRMLMVWYQESEKFSGCLYDGQFLYGLISQGNRFCQGRGFGFFRNKEKMLSALQENNLGEQNVIAFSWNGKEEKLTDITPLVRQEIHSLKTK